MKKTKKITLSFLAIIAFGVTIKASEHDYAALSFKNSIAQSYNNSFSQEEKELQTELFTIIDVSEQTWKKTQKAVAQEYKQACTETTAQERADKPLNKKIITAAISVLNNDLIQNIFGITDLHIQPQNKAIIVSRKNGKSLTIACGNKSIEADAATDQFTILIDPEILLETHNNESEIKATIAHELIHIMHQDNFHVYCLDYLQKKAKLSRKNKKLFKQTKGTWERFQEKRADILSGLIDLEYATAHKNHFERHMPENEKIKLTSTHPTENQRYTYMTLVVKKMEQHRYHYWLGFFLIFMFIMLFVTVIAFKMYQKKFKR
ncbi:hypothetical protein KAH94_00355 [bacterium]|nr:hypothetical protein [bacterium]